MEWNRKHYIGKLLFMKHATIIPLIGGEAIASEKVFGTRPEYILSYSVFKNNEKHLLNYWNNEVPYHVLDEQPEHPFHLPKVDVMSSVCPCAGLSQFSMHFGEDNPNNQWMIKTAKHVLNEVKPRVFWGENAPGLAGNIGKFVRDELREISLKAGYTFGLYRTGSLLHGVPQTRQRTFYFFWQGDRTPLLNYYNRPYTPIEEVISNVKSNSQMEPINTKTPSKDDPFYRYLLEVVYNGITHREFQDNLRQKNARTNDVQSFIERAGHTYKMMAEWMGKNGYENQVEKCLRKHKKLVEDSGNIMRRGTIVPKDYIGAFVGHYPNSLTHQYEDRYVTYREALTIMGMPDDFELLDPKLSTNHICQNVPVQTAIDMATEVKEALEGNRNWLNATYVYQNNNSQKYEIWDEQTSENLERFF